MSATVESDSDSIVHLRVSVARMEGMLTQALTDQGQRLTKTEGEIVAIHGRLNEKGKMLATHDAHIHSNTDRIHDLEESREGGTNRFLAILAGCVGAASFVFQFTPLGK